MQLCRCFPAFATYTLELVLFDVYCTLVLLLLPAACVLSESSHHLVPHPPSLFLFPVPPDRTQIFVFSLVLHVSR